MTIYTGNDIYLGAGAFEQAMRAQVSIPGRASRMSPGVAVGILSAAMRSGLPADLIHEVIAEHHRDSATLLKRLLDMYEGNDWAINLWHRLPSGRYKLCTDLCRPGLAQWRYDPLGASEDEA
ncbi:hypothetical protein HZY97_08420 [Sphingomonas sp. R-74633]|uniref:hypothetical protein n=1 Tax=Sphingomonas sp. R-74633 TaxID=2751188 RepID=UPI0015D285BD|nr:hypothetical protein [Sphingomonas sp. R-74633]NYT40777.1 hypothetical protein [Sphingomonas sp. R-74633]